MVRPATAGTPSAVHTPGYTPPALDYCHSARTKKQRQQGDCRTGNSCPSTRFPVEYVKVCSIYGAGFWYIPGTDTCIKIGGWVRVEADFNAGGSHTAYISGGGGRNNRIDSADLQTRSRFVTSFDIRTQTEYGTLRAYTRAGFQWTTNTDGIGSYYVERTFIQFAGFTLGRSQSYFDFYANVMYYTGYIGGPSTGLAAFARSCCKE